MITDDDAIYYAERERAERRLAASANNDAITAIHVAMATEYGRRAVAARNRTKLPPESVAPVPPNRA